MKDLTVGREGRNILIFTIPLLIGSVFQQMYNIVDSIVVGRYIGKEALAAIGNAFPIMFTLIALIIGIAFGGTIIVSQYFGAKDYDKVRKTIGTIYILMFSMAAFLSLIGLVFLDPILSLVDIPAEIYDQAKAYIQIIIGGIIVFFGFNGTTAILRGLGDSKTPMYFMIISTIANIFLDILFVVKFQWGIEGAAWATIISQGGAFITAVIYLNKTHKLISIRIKDFVFDYKIFIQTLRIGLPTGFQQTFVALGMMALIKIVNNFGTDVIAAYSVAGRIDAIAMQPAMVFSQGLAAFVGQNIGAGKQERVKKGLRATLLMSSAVSIVISLLIISFRSGLMVQFNSDPEVIRIGGEYLLIVSAFYILFSIMFTYGGVLRGAGDTLIPMFITLFALWVIRIPIAWWLSGKIGETGIWWAIPMGLATGALFSYLYYLTGRWKTKAVTKPRGQMEVSLSQK
ncbi:MAG: MATE family efflux transporter [Bacteroidales bacterium]|nr:MATE family efflux transporter [Bacteroidales bacterium]MCF8390140.1 MATE family efflux transporter [Bacteroidales bacterium]